jgi:NitT/TauT family transport system ATP-binding protein
MLEVQSLNKRFTVSEHESLTVLQDISFSVDKGEVVSIIGPSGCGKTTILRVIAGLEARDSGSVKVDGKEVTGTGKDRGLVFQTFNLFPWMTALENVEFGLLDLKPEERKKRAEHYLHLVGLSDFESYHPNRLSGGMLQRVGTARALAIEPEVLLLDEPMANVDAQTAETLLDEFLRIFQATGKTVIYVTHSMDEALYVSDRVLVLSARPARIIEVVNVGFPKPRWEHDIRSMPEFGSNRSRLRKLLGLAK